jgi:hypothetical protein
MPSRALWDSPLFGRFDSLVVDDGPELDHPQARANRGVAEIRQLRGEHSVSRLLLAGLSAFFGSQSFYRP